MICMLRILQTTFKAIPVNPPFLRISSLERVNRELNMPRYKKALGLFFKHFTYILTYQLNLKIP